MKYVRITRNNATVILGITPQLTPRNGGRSGFKRAEHPVGTPVLRAALGHPVCGKLA